MLASGKSFRTTAAREAIQHGHSCFSLHGRFESAHDILDVQLDRCLETRKLRVNDGPANETVALVRLVPIVVLAPNTHREFLSDAAVRRRALYWGMFHMEPLFLSHWREYSRVLAQRNAQLRAQVFATSIWDTQLATQGEVLDRAARDYIQRLSPLFSDTLERLGATTDSIGLHLSRGWEGPSLMAALNGAKAIDCALKRTSRGFHRSDLAITVNGIRAAAFASYGQQKAIVTALYIAQLRALLAQPKQAILLFDDLPADWDRNARRRALDTIAALESTQIFVTATEDELIPDCPGRAFHVEHGKLNQI